MKIRVMLVDDEPFILQGLSMLIDWEKVNCEIVKTAANGKEAYEYLKENRVDLILADIEMPEMDGFEATERIRKLPNRIRANVPIIALTANAVAENRERATVVGIDDFLVKPTKYYYLLLILLYSRFLHIQAFYQYLQIIYSTLVNILISTHHL